MKLKYFIQLVIVSFFFSVIVSCGDMIHLALKTVQYTPHQIIYNKSKDEFSLNDLIVYRQYLYKSNKSKSKKTEICFDYFYDSNDSDTLMYKIHVNNHIKSRKNAKTVMFPPYQNLQRLDYFYFKHRQFKEDTIRIALFNEEKTDTLVDVSFIIDEKDSIPTNTKFLYFDNQTDKMAYVGIAGIEKKSATLVFLEDMCAPSKKKSGDYIKPNLISPLLWKEFIEEDFDKFYVVAFPNIDEINKWKFDPHYTTFYPTFTFSSKDFHLKDN